MLSFIVCAIIFSGCADETAVAPQKQLIVWHWMSDKVGAFDRLSEEYKHLTGIKIKFELYAPTSAYASKVRSAAQADKLPDIYGVHMEMRDYASFIKAGFVRNLTSYMDADNGEWKNRFFPNGLAMNTFTAENHYGVKPGIYGVPVDLNNIQMVYNLDLLKKAGWDTAKMPSTWIEFMALADKLKAAGVPGLISGWGEAWMIHCLADNFAWNILGRENIIKTINGEIKYTDPLWLEVFALFKDIKDHDLFFPGSVIMVNKEAEQIFANGRAAIAFNGSWCVNVYASMNPELRYAVAPPPRVNLANAMYIWGGTTSFIVNDSSAMKEDAVNFLKWLTETKQQNEFAVSSNNIPATRACAETLKGPVAEFADKMGSVVHPRLLPVEEFPLVTEAFDKGIQSIIIGEAAPEQIAETVQKTKEKETEKAARFKLAPQEKL